MSRLVIVSNRLPLSAKLEDGRWSLAPGGGGLVSGLSPVRDRRDTLWLGWPGVKQDLGPAELASLDQLLEGEGLAAVHLPAALVRSYYDDFCNGIVWPLFHFLPMQLPLRLTGFEAYQEANQRFADRLSEFLEPDDLVWVHDYQLSLLPGLLRHRHPKLRIGFFLHIPFPSSEIFRILPWRKEMLEGMLGADVIGFHTAHYANNFGSCVRRLLGVEPKLETMSWQGRSVRFGAFPLGIDVQRFAGPGAGSAQEDLAGLKQHSPVSKLFLGVDRLDYTKGIPRRLAAFERLLDLYPDLRGSAVLVQVAVPGSREARAFEDTRCQVDELVGRINGRFGGPAYQPIHYIARSFSTDELIALYRSVDVMLVTPLRDGMNLIAKEFCASRIDVDGVLVLSEFAGAADELGEALLVNPYDIDAMAETYHAALSMPPEERQERMRTMRNRLEQQSNERWADSFLALLNRPEPLPWHCAEITADKLASDTLAPGRSVVLILDYDGTIVPIADLPELALPDDDLLARIEALSHAPGVQLVLVSGRDRDFIERWFGRFPGVTLYAEHGLWQRCAGDTHWRPLLDMAGAVDWKVAVRAMLERACDDVPGSRIEEKSASLVWHYRLVEPEFGQRKARELHFLLTEALANLPVEVTTGKCVVEVRRAGVSKALAVRAVRHAFGKEPLYLALGDDETDEDMFRALPRGGYPVRVGGPSRAARFYLNDVMSARQFLDALGQMPSLRSAP